MGFEEFAGNEYIKAQLTRFISAKQILNSYIFVGEGGIGKKTLSDTFIKGILCEAPLNGGACGNCFACRQVASGNHPDVIFLKKKKDKKTIGIDEIREQIIKQAYVKPFVALKKIFVIQEGDDMTQEAQNGLLKVLEEPPEYVTFITLVSKKSILLDTVLSRSCVLNLKPVTQDEVLGYLQKIAPSASHDDLVFYARFSQGIIGKAVKIMEDEDYRNLFFTSSQLLASVMKSKEAAFDFHRYLLDNKDEISVITDFMLIFLRDCIFLSEGLGNMVICPQNLNGIYAPRSEKRKFTSCMDSVIKYKNMLSANANFTALSLNLLTEIQNNCNIY